MRSSPRSALLTAKTLYNYLSHTTSNKYHFDCGTMVFGTPWKDNNNQPNDEPKNNTDWSKGAKVAGIVALTGVATVAWPVALGAAGWTAGGVAAGSMAATIQASIGNVAAGSAFAFLQGAGAGGAAAGVVNGVAWGAGGMAAVLEALRGEKHIEELREETKEETDNKK